MLVRNLILSRSGRCWRGFGVGPDAPFGALGFFLGQSEAAFHRVAETPAEPRFGQAGADQLFVEHRVAVPDKGQVAAVIVEPFHAEGEPHAVRPPLRTKSLVNVLASGPHGSTG